MTSDELIGQRVRIKKNQQRLGGDKCPGRFGIIVEIDEYKEPLIYVDLEPTNRAKARQETFWLRDLVFTDYDLHNKLSEAK